MNLKHTAQSLLRQNYHITNSYHQLRLQLEGQRKGSKIVIYQMGKVGSTTIWNSLKALNLNSPIYHIHTLDNKKIRDRVQQDKDYFSKKGFLLIETLHSEYLRRQLDMGLKTPWDVIVLFRDPVAKVLSGFFQILGYKKHLGIDYREKVRNDGGIVVVKDLIDEYYQECVNNPKRLHPFEWFSRELKEYLDFDVFSAADMLGKDYQIYSNENARILFLKLESLNVSCQSAFQDFLGIENLELVKANRGQEKQYGKLYQRFLHEVNLPNSYLDEMYQTDLVRHFYCESEIQQFYQRWSAG